MEGIILNKETLKLSIIFFKKGKSYYFKYDNEICSEVTSYNINKLKEHLNSPFKVKFIGMSKSEIKKIIAYLLDDTMEVSIKKINSEKENLLIFEASFIHSTRIIEAYKVPNESCLYGRSTNCNPFLYTEINGKKVLIETTKDYAKNNVGDYYFLSCDLSVAEKTFFDSSYTKLEYDYLYRIETEFNDKKTKQKILDFHKIFKNN